MNKAVWFRKYWKKKTPEYREKMRLAHRARIEKCSVIIPFSKREVIQRDGSNCYLCKKYLKVSEVTIDHIIPLSRGGFHCLSNAKVCCSKCNKEKGNKTFLEFMRYLDRK